VSLELSKSAWLVAVSAPGSDKMSEYQMAAGDGAMLLSLPARLTVQVEWLSGGPVEVISIHEEGFGAF
jgi:hypothetical protein